MDVDLELRGCAGIVLAAYLFSVNVWLLGRHGIDVAALYGIYGPRSRPPWRIAHILLCILIAGVIVARIIPSRLVLLGTLVASIAVLTAQLPLRRVMARVAVGSLSADHRLGDILVSDTLVSLASLLVDVTLGLVAIFNGVPLGRTVSDQGVTSVVTTADIRSQLQSHWVLLAGGLPGAIRIKQCVVDFRRTGQAQHLANLLKYMVGNIPWALRGQIAAGNVAAEAWIPSALLVSALYNLWWDIVMDWRLLAPTRHHAFARPVYWAAALTDSTLRFAFMARSQDESRIFALELLEVFRRGVWVMFRVEGEGAPPAEDIELPSIAH